MDTKNKLIAALNALNHSLPDLSFQSAEALKTMCGVIQILEDIILNTPEQVQEQEG